MKLNKWFVIIILLSIVGTFIVYPNLPDVVPTHWNIHGEVDATGGKATIFITAFSPLFIYFLMLVLPKIDPRKEAHKKHKKAYSVIIGIIIVFFLVIHWLVILVSLGYETDIISAIWVLTGILFIVMGVYLPQVKRNYFLGVRTPWTLSDDVVWKKTHKLSGILFLLIGLIMAVTSILQASNIYSYFLISLIVMLIIIFVYSYLEYKKIHKE